MKTSLLSNILATFFFAVFIFSFFSSHNTFSIQMIGMACFMKLNAMHSEAYEKESASFFNPNAKTFLEKIKQENNQDEKLK